MSDAQIPDNKKGFFKSVLQNIFQNELRNRDELVELIRDSEQNSIIDQETLEMLEGVMEISELRVRDLMIPRAQIIFINNEQSFDSCLDVIIDSAHSRFPVISDERDNVEGLLLAKDLLQFSRAGSPKFDMNSILRPAVIVPESKRVDRMLKEFRDQRFHMAVVVDEFGAISGLITIEDILEQIVGEIEDEFDEEGLENIRQLSQHIFSVTATTELEEFNEYFKTSYVHDEVDTIGGLILQSFGHLPNKDEEITLGDFSFKVTAANSRRIIRLRVHVSDDHLAQ